MRFCRRQRNLINKRAKRWAKIERDFQQCVKVQTLRKRPRVISKMALLKRFLNIFPRKSPKAKDRQKIKDIFDSVLKFRHWERDLASFQKWLGGLAKCPLIGLKQLVTSTHHWLCYVMFHFTSMLIWDGLLSFQQRDTKLMELIDTLASCQKVLYNLNNLTRVLFHKFIFWTLFLSILNWIFACYTAVVHRQ